MENKITSIKKIARIGGVLYLIIIILGILGEIFVRGKLIVSGDVTATANNIMASPLLWRLGIAGDLFMHVCDVGFIVVFYIILKPVNKNLVLLAVLFTLIQSAVLVAYKIKLCEALFLLGDADYLKAFEPQQLHALAYLAIKSDGYGFGIGLIFFGFACLINGYLIIKSGYIPKIFGIMLQIAGLCYLTNSFALLLAPGFADKIFPAILFPSFIGELSLCIWLLVKGVNLQKWEEKTGSGALAEHRPN